MNPISIAGFSVHGLLDQKQINVFGYLESCRYRYDLRTADIWNGLLTSIEPEYLQAVRNAMDERDLTLVNYHADGVHLWEDDPEHRERNYQGALQHLQAAVILGAKTVRFDTGGKLQPMTDEQADYIIKRYSEYAQFASDHGFRVGPETHWGISLIADNMEAIARGVNHPAYGVLLHIGHWECGDPDDGDKRMVPYTMHTHVDANTTHKRLDEKIALLMDGGYTGAWGVEHHSGRNEYAEIGAQLALVRRAVAKYAANAREQKQTRLERGESHNPFLTLEQEGRA